MAEDIPLSNIVNVSISTSVGAITETGYGTPNILTDEDTYDDGARTRSYSSISEVEDDWASSTAAYQMAAAIFAQSPTVEVVKISTEDTRVAQVQTIVFSADIVTGNSIACTIDGTALSATAFTTDNATTLAALATKIQATAGVSTAVSDGSHTITVTAQNAGIPVTISGVLVTSGASQATATITTTVENHGVAEDLDEIIENDDDWYFFLWNEQTTEYIDLAADTIESLNKQYVAASADSGIITDADTANPAYYIMNATLERSRVFYHSDPTSYPDAALIGKVAPYDPGATHARYQELEGIEADDLSTSERSAIEEKQAFYYGTMGGRNVVIEPIRTDGKYMDTIRDRDYVRTYVQEQVAEFVIDTVQSGEKIPYTQAGIDMIEAKLRAVLDYLVNTKKVITFEGIDDEDQIVVPDIDNVSSADKSARTLNDVSFTCVLQGAIYKFVISGILTS